MKPMIRVASAAAALVMTLPAWTSVEAAGRGCQPDHLVGGGAGYCVIRVDGRVVCWGGGPNRSPLGRFRNVSVGTLRCGVREDGEGVCWGGGAERIVGGDLLQLSVVDWIGAYAIRADGTLDYLPFPNYPEEPDVPGGTFLEISAGCARRTDETLVCLNGQVPPAGKFEQVAGPCAISETGNLECWGGWENVVDPVEGAIYRHVSSSNGWSSIRSGEGVCAVTVSGEAKCWGANLITEVSPDEEFREVAFGYGWPWGLTTDGRLVPWAPWPEPTTYSANAKPIFGTFAQIATGGDGSRPLTCALEASGSLQCWGSNQFGQVEAPDGVFLEVAAGAYHACGLRSDATIECWGNDDSLRDTDAPAGQFSSLAIGWFGPNCALRKNGAVACWGYGELVLDVPAGEFETISAGGEIACALDGDGLATCWRYVEGDTPDEIVTEPAEVPPGAFAQVANYFDGGPTWQNSHVCGRRPNGQVTCWTDEDGVQAWTPPSGTFAKLAPGGAAACGLRSDGRIECWGPGWIEDFVPPQGEFVEVASGGGQVCGLSGDGTVVCTGSDETITLCAPSLLCGNGDIDDSESCDDGDTSFAPGDACTGGCWSVPCGQPLHPEEEGPVASDALFALRAAVGASACSPGVCDVNSSSSVTAADALAILRKSVDPNRSLACS